MISNFTFEWFNKLVENGTLPTKYEVLSTVSTKTAYADRSPDGLYKRVKCRSKYIHDYSFPLMTEEVVTDMAKYLSGLNVLEVCGGNGYISKCIKDADPSINIICTDDYSWEERCRNHFMEVEKLDAVDAVEKYADQVEFVLLSWPPHDEPIATKVLEKCLEKNLNMIYIGEQWMGCTADDTFFDLIDAKCIMESITDNYVSFEGLHDDIYVIHKKF